MVRELSPESAGGRVFDFYLRDVVSAILATATWLGGWMSHAGIVSILLNLS